MFCSYFCDEMLAKSIVAIRPLRDRLRQTCIAPLICVVFFGCALILFTHRFAPRNQALGYEDVFADEHPFY